MGSSSSLSKITEIVIVTATVVLLFLVSATVIARTYCLRRYRRQMLAQAIANGTHPLLRPDPGDRPRMFEVYVGEDLLADQCAGVGECGAGFIQSVGRDVGPGGLAMEVW